MGEAKRRKQNDPSYGLYSQGAKQAIENLLAKIKEGILVDSSDTAILAFSDNKLRGYSQVEVKELKDWAEKHHIEAGRDVQWVCLARWLIRPNFEPDIDCFVEIANFRTLKGRQVIEL